MDLQQWILRQLARAVARAEAANLDATTLHSKVSAPLL